MSKKLTAIKEKAAEKVAEKMEVVAAAPAEKLAGKVAAPAKKKKEAKTPGMTLTLEQKSEAVQKHSDMIGLKFAEMLKAKLVRHYGAHKIGELLPYFTADKIDPWFNPLLTVHTFSHTRGDVVTAYINDQGHPVPFTSLMEFLACQVDHSQIWEKRLKCWTDMYFKGIKNADEDWIAQYERERKTNYKVDKGDDSEVESESNNP